LSACSIGKNVGHMPTKFPNEAESRMNVRRSGNSGLLIEHEAGAAVDARIKARHQSGERFRQITAMRSSSIHQRGGVCGDRNRTWFSQLVRLPRRGSI